MNIITKEDKDMKKSVVLLLGLAMAASLLAGCGSKPAEAQKTQAAADSTAAGKAEDGGAGTEAADGGETSGGGSVSYTHLDGYKRQPHIISLVSVSMVFLWLFDSQVGFLNSIITAIGLNAFPFFTSPKTALFSLVLVMVWKQAGYYTLLIMAALQGVPQEIYEAASIDDAPAYKTFFRITLPMISPTLFFLSLIHI